MAAISQDIAADPVVMEVVIDKDLRTPPAAIPTANDPSELKQTISSLEAAIAALKLTIARLEADKEDLEADVAIQANTLNALEKAGAFTSAAKNAVEAQLKEEKARRELAEETVEMLRGKLEDSRKVIGSMQQQDKRASSSNGGLLSPASVSTGTFGDGDLGGLGFLGAISDTNATKGMSTKRESGLARPFALNMGNNRRISDNLTSSASEPILPSSASLPLPPVTVRSGLRELRLGTSSGVTMQSPPSPSPAALGSPSAENSSHLTSPVRTPTRDRSRPNSYSKRDASPAQSADLPGAKLRAMANRSPVNTVSGSKLESSPSLEAASPPAEIDLSSDRSSSETTTGVSNEALAEAKAKEAAATAKATQALAEADKAKLEIAMLKAKLWDSQEAREASERALRTLREFMSSTNAHSEESDAHDTESIASSAGRNSIVGLKLPPLPTEIDTEEEEASMAASAPRRPSKQVQASTWRSPSFSLWRGGAPSPGLAAPELYRKSSMSPSITPSTTSGHSSLETMTSPPMSPPVSVQDKDLPETPALPIGTLGSFVSSWSKGITSPAPVAVGSETVTPVTPAYQGPAVKRAFSFFGSLPARPKSNTVSSSTTDASEEIKLDVSAVMEDNEGETREAQAAAADEAELDEALAQAAITPAEPATPKASTSRRAFSTDQDRSPSDLPTVVPAVTSPLKLTRRAGVESDDVPASSTMVLEESAATIAA